MAFISFSRGQTAPIWLPGPVLALLDLFDGCLLLLCIWMSIISPKPFATLYLGPTRSFWACIEGMDGLHVLFTGANVSDLAAWARFGTFDLFEIRLLLQCVLVLPNSSTHVATLHLGPMRSLWACIEGMDGLHVLSTGANGSDLVAWARFGTFDLFKIRLLL